MKKLFVTVFTLLLSVVSAFAADATGKWVGQMTTPDGNTIPLSYTLKQDGMKLTGTTEGPAGTVEIKEGKVEGEKISFFITFEGGNGAMKISQTGTISGDEITMTFVMEGGPEGGLPPLKLTRAK